jgi:sulfonate transport system substrate-binding protein
MKKVIALSLAAVLMAGLFLTGCSQATTAADTATATAAPATEAATEAPAAATAEPVTIRVATLAQQLSLPMYYISQQGWDVENGFKLEITTFSQGTGINEALGSGLVDICTIGAAGVSSCSVYDAEYIYSHEDSAAGQNLYIRADSDVAQTKGYVANFPELLGTPETIKGKTILLPMGTGSQIHVDTYLSLFGLTEDDVTLVNMDTAAGYQAFVSGQGDFVNSAYPTSDEYGTDYVLASSMNNSGVPYYDNIIASRAFYTDNKDAIVKLIVQLIRCAEAFKDQDLLWTTMQAWYELNGQQANPNAQHQVLERPFFTYDDLTNVDTTAAFKAITEFYASIGNITSDDMTHVFNNMDTELLGQALEAYAAQYK